MKKCELLTILAAQIQTSVVRSRTSDLRRETWAVQLKSYNGWMDPAMQYEGGFEFDPV